MKKSELKAIIKECMVDLDEAKIKVKKDNPENLAGIDHLEKAVAHISKAQKVVKNKVSRSAFDEIYTSIDKVVETLMGVLNT
jgi:hypothetical protein